MPRQGLGFAYLAITATGWALNFTLMKFLLLDWPPLFSRGLAGLVGASALALFALFLGESLALPRRLVGRIFGEAFTNVFAWMGFSTLALLWLPVGQNLLLIYTMPIWAMLLAWPINGTKPTRRNVVSLTLGLAGVVLLFGGQGTFFRLDVLMGCALSLGAALLFALGTVLNRTPIAMPFVVRTAWQVGLGCLPMVLLGLVFEHPRFGALSLSGFGIMIYMAIVAMALCYVTWFGALRYLAPSTASAGLLAVPVLGMILAAMVLGEPFGVQQVVALVLTLGGVVLALQPAHVET
nr:EamA/RhaT family transporter [Rhizobium sp. Q54]